MADGNAGGEPGAGLNLGWRDDRRPAPRLGTALGGAGGALVAAGFVSMGAETAPDNGDAAVAAAVICLLAIVAAFAVAARDESPEPVRAACAAVVAICVPFALGFLIVPDSETYSDVRPLLIVGGLAWLGTWMFGSLRGRAVFLSLALVVGWFWIASEVSSPDSPVGFVDDTTTNPLGGTTVFDTGESSFDDDVSSDDDTAPAAIVSLAFAGLYFGTMVGLDRRRRRGTATAFVVPGAFALTAGLQLLAVDMDVVAVGLITAAAGLLVCWAGSASARRFTTWFGAVVAVAGVVVVAVDVTDRLVNDEGTNGLVIFGLVAIVLGATAVAGAVVLSRRLGEPELDTSSSQLPEAGAPGPV